MSFLGHPPYVLFNWVVFETYQPTFHPECWHSGSGLSSITYRWILMKFCGDLKQSKKWNEDFKGSTAGGEGASEGNPKHQVTETNQTRTTRGVIRLPVVWKHHSRRVFAFFCLFAFSIMKSRRRQGSHKSEFISSIRTRVRPTHYPQVRRLVCKCWNDTGGISRIVRAVAWALKGVLVRRCRLDCHNVRIILDVFHHSSSFQPRPVTEGSQSVNSVFK